MPANVRIIDTPAEWSRLFKSPGMQALLASEAQKRAASANALASEHSYSFDAQHKRHKEPMRMPAYKARVKVLKDTAVGIVRPTTKQGVAIENKYHILKKFSTPEP